MLIGEICEKSGLSRDTIRYYEKRKLIKVEISNSEFNNYKNYTEENLKRLILIKKSKKFGFTLNEISELLELFDDNKANCSMLSQKVTAKISEIDNRIRELENMKSLILSSIQDAQKICEEKDDNRNCKEFTN